METFNFSLQRVLDLRTYERKKAERALARVQQRRKSLEEQLRRLQRDFEQSFQACGSSDLKDFRRITAHRRATRKRRRRLREELEELKTREADARTHLVEQRREEDTLRSLYEDERDAHRDEQMRTHQQLIDEQATAQYLRQNPLRSS